MKNSYKIIPLLIATGSAVVAFADAAGVNVPSVSPESALSVFVASVLGLLFIADYTRSSRKLSLNRAPVIIPASGAFSAKCAAKTECLAA